MNHQTQVFRKRLCLVVSAVLLTLCLMPAVAFGADTVALNHTAGFFAVQGDNSVSITVKATANSSTFAYSLVLTSPKSDIVVTNEKIDVFAGGDVSTIAIFSVDVSKKASVGQHELKLTATSADTVIGTESVWLDVAENKDSFSSLGGAAFDVAYSVSGGQSIVAGQTNMLSLSLFNRGNTMIKNARISISLPEGLTIKSGAATINAGYISIGKTFVASYPIAADATISTKSYPIVVKIAGLNSSNEPVSVEETVYIPVAGSGGSGELDLEIVGVSAPASVSAGSDFVVTFGIKNKGNYEATNIKAELLIPEGAINKSKNVFLIHSLAAGATQSCTVTLNAQKGGQYLLFELSAGNADGTNKVSQYAGTMISGGASTSVNPQLMVSAYSYGGAPVKAGAEFNLSLSLNNTSVNTALQNIKVTVTSNDNSFLPVGTSNSFYVASIAAGTTSSKSMRFAAAKDAEQQTTTVTVSMSYEDTSGGTHTSSDIISIPVIQETRLVIDEILDPGYLTVDQMGYLNVNYYNMGKTQLSNLRISTEGDFIVDGSASLYVGNMASGKSDYCSFNFFPNGVGELKGKVIFAFEDAAGQEQSLEKHFTFNIGEAYVPEEDPNFPPEGPSQGGSAAWKWLAGLGILSGMGFVGYKYMKKKRDKKTANEEFDLDE